MESPVRINLEANKHLHSGQHTSEELDGCQYELQKLNVPQFHSTSSLGML